MVDIEAAIGFVVARGDQVDRARLSWLRSELPPPPGRVAKVEMGQSAEGGWPAFWGGDVPSIDATCFRLAELDDLGALDRPAARAALAWLASRQRPDGTWQEDEALADTAPPWAHAGRPGGGALPDRQRRLLAGGRRSAPEPATVAAGQPVRRGGRAGHPGVPGGAAAGRHLAVVPGRRLARRRRMLYHTGWFYEAAQIQVMLRRTHAGHERRPMSRGWRRRCAGPGCPTEDFVLEAALASASAETQRTDGGWASDDGDAFDVHTTLAAIRGVR